MSEGPRVTGHSSYPGWQAWLASDEARALMDGPRQGSRLEALAFVAYVAGLSAANGEPYRFFRTGFGPRLHREPPQHYTKCYCDKR